MGTHLRILSDSYLMNANMTGIGWFSKIFASNVSLDESSLSIRRVNPLMPRIHINNPLLYL